MLRERYLKIRTHTTDLVEPLQKEDFVVQPVVDVSPPKWHLAHTTWFFETFLLKPHLPHYKEFDPKYNYLFNSYYETLGTRVMRTDRGNLSRPPVDEVYRYREYVDKAMTDLLSDVRRTESLKDLILLGLNHEEQHQELLMTDIKYILGHNPLFPVYSATQVETPQPDPPGMISIDEGIYEIGYKGSDFCFDNELGRHKVFLHHYRISSGLVSNEIYLDFIEDGGYQNFRFWHSEGWDWVKRTNAEAPLYWHNIEGKWYNYTLAGFVPVNLKSILTHVNFFEAHAFAEWAGKRLPTEFEWETAAGYFNWGKRWEWTESAYLPYPFYRKAEGAIGEYNGKFMVNQMVLRGGSTITPEGHSRISYRNFFHPHLQWQFTGIRLAE